MNENEALIRNLDCYSLPVGDLDAGIAFYAKLGHALLWRDEGAAGLRLPGSESEIVLRTDGRPVETCLTVDSVAEAAAAVAAAGGRLEFGPIDIRIGRYALLRDPWGNPLPVLDFSKGRLATDAEGRVVGNERPAGDSLTERDRFARLLGIRVVEAGARRAVVEMDLRGEHRNGAGGVHGGVIFTLADYAFAVAANDEGVPTLAVNASISYFRPPRGNRLRAEATEDSTRNKICGYRVAVLDEDGSLAASFAGLGYRKA